MFYNHNSIILGRVAFTEIEESLKSLIVEMAAEKILLLFSLMIHNSYKSLFNIEDFTIFIKFNILLTCNFTAIFLQLMVGSFKASPHLNY